MADDGLQLYQHTSSAYLNVTEQAGLPPDLKPEWMTFADINGDNWLDLYMSVRDQFIRVYLNNGDGAFTEKAQELGLKFIDAKGVFFSDLNGDNRVDAYVCGDRIYFQEADGDFLVDPDVSIRPDPDIMDACVGDYDNDGDMDVYVCRDSEQPNSLYRNTGSGQFEEVTQQTDTGDEGDGVSANFMVLNNSSSMLAYYRKIKSKTITSRAGAIYWDGRNESGERVASGVYFYTMKAGDFKTTRKMAIVK